MITGFNTDVDYDGKVYHVQTEDKGRSNPVVETLVYSGGQVVESLKTPYKELAGSELYSEEAVLKRMESQHQAMIREISNGKYDPDGPKPFGYNLISNRSLDAVVFEFLLKEFGVEQIRLEILDQPVFVEGDTPEITLSVLEEPSERPVSGAKVVVKLFSTQSRPAELFSGVTDADGRVRASFEIPHAPKVDKAIVCQAEAAGKNAEIKQLVLGKPKRRPKRRKA